MVLRLALTWATILIVVVSASAQVCTDYADLPTVTSTMPLGDYGGVMGASDTRLCAYDSSVPGMVWAALDQGDDPVPLGSWPVIGPMVYDVAVFGELAILGRSSNVLTIVDFSDPTAPVVACSDTMDQSIGALDVIGGRLYLAVRTQGLRVLDLADPGAPLEIGRIADGASVTHFAVAGDRLWASGKVDFTSFIRLYDIADPAAPVLLDEKTLDDWGETGANYLEVAVGDGVGILQSGGFYTVWDIIHSYTVWNFSIHVLDLSAGDEIVFAATHAYGRSGIVEAGVIDGVPVGRFTESVASFGFDASGAARQLNMLGWGSQLRGFAASAGRVWVSVGERVDGCEGAWHRPGAVAGMTSVGSWDAVSYAAFTDDRAFVSVGNGWWADPGDVPYGSIQIYDTTDPDAPVRIDAVAAMDMEHQGPFLLNGEYIYGYIGITHWPTDTTTWDGDSFTFTHSYMVGDATAYEVYGQGLRIVDLSDPVVPTVVDEILATSTMGAGCDAGDRVYQETSEGIAVLGVADPLAPTVRNIVPIGQDWIACAVAGNHLYAVGVGGLWIYGLADPDLPTQVGCYGVERLDKVVVSGHLAYVGEYHGGCRVIDVSDPTLPVEIGRATLGGDMQGLTLIGDRLMTLSDKKIVTLYPECGDPVGNEDVDEEIPEPVPTFRFAPPAPNPFNPATVLSFSLSVPGEVSLTIHDLAGRRVRTLVDRAMPTGDHRATWQGRDDAGRKVPAGTYVARLRTGERSEARKLVLLK